MKEMQMVKKLRQKGDWRVECLRIAISFSGGGWGCGFWHKNVRYTSLQRVVAKRNQKDGSYKRILLGRITISEVECFDPLANEWRLSKPLPESRSESGAVVI
jgi:hypothetical protein